MTKTSLATNQLVSTAIATNCIVVEPPEPSRLMELLARPDGTATAPSWIPSRLPAWPDILRDGLGHQPYVLSALDGERLVAEGRAGLMDRRVAPGDSVAVTLVIAPLPRSGKFRLLVDMVEEQHCWFYQAGSEPYEEELVLGE